MKLPFGIYDFLGYTVPGFVVIILILILINPAVLEHRLNDTTNGLGKYLPTTVTVTQGIFYIFVCYIVGLASHGFINWLFKVLSGKWKPFKRYYSDRGTFEKVLFFQEYRDYPEDFYPYSDQFVCKLKKQIEEKFDIKINRRNKEEEYTEIFHLCRTAFMKHSPDLYPRAATLLALYNAAKLLGGIFFLATVGFFLKIVVPLVVSFASPQDFLEKIWGGIGNTLPLLLWLVVFVLLRIEEKNGEKVNCVKTNRLGYLYWIFVGVFGFILWICVVSLAIADNFTANLFICYWVSASLCPIFFHLYHLFFRYYRNSILYGFYESARNPEKSDG